MKSLEIMLIIILTSFFTLNISQAQNIKNTKVLFIGNSLTYYNDVPSMVSALYFALDHSNDIKTELIASGGISLEQHLTKPLVLDVIKNSKYHIVILQDFGGWPLCYTGISACSKTSEPLEILINAIRYAKARPIWYSTYQADSKFQISLSQAAELIATRLNVEMADVGFSLQKFIKSNKDIVPFESDGHLNEVGSWIAAATIVRTIIGHNIPENLILELVCLNQWKGTNLQADKLASEQKSKSKNCKYIDKKILKNIITAINN